MTIDVFDVKDSSKFPPSILYQPYLQGTGHHTSGQTPDPIPISWYPDQLYRYVNVKRDLRASGWFWDKRRSYCRNLVTFHFYFAHRLSSLITLVAACQSRSLSRRHIERHTMLQSFSTRRGQSFHEEDEDVEDEESSAGQLPGTKGSLRGLVDQRHGDTLSSDVMSTAVSDSGMSDFGYLDNQTIGDNSVEEVAFDTLNKEIQAVIQEKPVRTVIKLCFSSMAVVFRETILIRDPEQPPFQYIRFPSIPTAAARMLWSELLGGIECTLSGKTNEYVAKVASGDFGGELDESISTSVLRGFLSAVNRKENKALSLLRTGTNLFKRKENDDSARNIQSIEALEEKKKSKDPFLYFIRQQLLKADLVELSGRRFYDSIQSLGDSNMWDEEDENI